MIGSITHFLESKIFWRVFIVLYLLYHLMTLSISPLPWFDETFFLDIANNVANEGQFTYDITPPLSSFGNVVYTYGPVYFWMTGLVIKIFGIGVFQFRLVGLIAILLSAIVLKKILKTNWEVFLLIFLFDPLFITASHNARMDSLLILFGLISILFILKERSIINISISALAASLTMLTSPRGVVVIIGVMIVLFIDFLKTLDKRAFFNGLIWASVFSVPILIWILFIFGDITTMVEYYESFSAYVGGRFYIQVLEIPLIVITSILVVVNIVKKRLAFFTSLNIISISGILFFYLTVSDTGPYSILILPFYIILFHSSLFNLNSQLNLYGFVKLGLLAGYLLLFSVKSYVIFSQMKQRKPELAKRAFEMIPEGSRVIGDEMYTYEAFKHKCSFQYIHLNYTPEYRESYQRDTFDYEYIIWSNRLQEKFPSYIEPYKNNSNLIIIDKVDISKVEVPHLVARFIKPIDDYSCTVYKRIKE